MSRAPEIDVRELSEDLERGTPITLLDIREPHEWAICRIEGAHHLPLSEFAEGIGEIPTGRDIVVICHHGLRSELVVDRLRVLGYESVANLRGGIDAWAREIDPEMPRY